MSALAHPEFIDWIWDPFDDDDESSPMGFNDPMNYEPGDEEDGTE
jgi:hypothetical protein